MKTKLTMVVDHGAPKRQCGECNLCCKLLPMQGRTEERVLHTAEAMLEHGWMTLAEATSMIPDFDKPAGVRCRHQRHHKGCAIYSRRPLGCRMWNCLWLTGADTDGMLRPDRAHYVIDIMPDVVRMLSDGGAMRDVPVTQVWVDPHFPNAHLDPALRAYMLRRAEEGIATMVRYGSQDGFTIFPPPLSHDSQWHDTRECERPAQLMHREGHDLDPDNWTAAGRSDRE
jgi:Fe-S-cluster containining protein